MCVAHIVGVNILPTKSHQTVNSLYKIRIYYKLMQLDDERPLVKVLVNCRHFYKEDEIEVWVSAHRITMNYRDFYLLLYRQWTGVVSTINERERVNEIRCRYIYRYVCESINLNSELNPMRTSMTQWVALNWHAAGNKTQYNTKCFRQNTGGFWQQFNVYCHFSLVNHRHHRHPLGW